MSEFAHGIEVSSAPVRGGGSSTGVVLVLFILLVIVSSIFLA